MGQTLRTTLPALLAALILTACGGGGGGGDSSSSASTSASVATASNTAAEGIAQFNTRREQIGLQRLTRNSVVDRAAQGHSDYQAINNTISHEQIEGRPGFTGVELDQRLKAAGYNFTQSGGYAYGEVISSTGSNSGVSAAEDLIAAIYHRFVIFEPMFKEVGAGAATVSGGNTYFTTNFTANGLNSGLPGGQFVIYPYNGQQDVARNFMSDNESPDPVPDRNEVGYPISVHANILASVAVQEFTVRPQGGGSDLPVRLLSAATDSQTPSSAASIVPLAPLAAGTTYAVRFVGTVDGTQVSRDWTFTTR